MIGNNIWHIVKVIIYGTLLKHEMIVNDIDN